MDGFFYHMPVRIRFGDDSVDLAGITLEQFGPRAIIIADPFSEETALLDGVRASLRKQGIESILFTDVTEESTNRVVEDMVKLGRAGRATIVLGIGDARLLSLAKIAAWAIPSRTEPSRVFRSHEETRTPLPFAAIPTGFRDPFLLTAEALYTDSRDRSVATMDTGRPPEAVFIDPVFASGLPFKMMQYTAFEILLHAAEGLCSGRCDPIGENGLLEALSMISSLMGSGEKTAIHSLARASLFASLGLVNARPGIGTALAYALGGALQVPETAAAAILLPHALGYYAEVLDDRMAGVEGFSDTPGFVEAVRGWLAEAGVPLRLRDLEVGKEDLAVAAHNAVDLDMIKLSEAPVSESEAADLLAAAL